MSATPTRSGSSGHESRYHGPGQMTPQDPKSKILKKQWEHPVGSFDGLVLPKTLAFVVRGQ